VNITLSVAISGDVDTGQYSWQVQIYTDLPSNGGYCIARYSGSTDIEE